MGGKKPVPKVRPAFVILGSHDLELNHSALLARYFDALKFGAVPESLCGLEGPQPIECTNDCRCLECWSQLPDNAVCVARSTGEAVGGSIEATHPRPSRSDWVYGMHTVRWQEVTVTSLVCTTEGEAEEYAKAASTDDEVLAAAVTRYLLDTPGELKPLKLFVAGQEQIFPFVSDDRRIFANDLSR
jgi:hypothetical protein